MTRLQRSPAPGALALAALVLAGCGSSDPPLAPTEAPVVTISQPLERPITDFEQYTGRLEAAETVEVRARVRGELTRILFRDGALVKEGDVLFVIDPRTYQTSLDTAEARKANAEASLRLAESEYARNLDLLRTKAASARDVEVWLARKGIALADVAAAEAEIDRARLDLEFTTIKAPITGRASRPLVTRGNLVNAGGGDTLLTTIVSVDPIHAYFDVDERALALYRERRAKEFGTKDREAAQRTTQLARAAAALGAASPAAGAFLAPQASGAAGVAAFDASGLEDLPPTIPVTLSLITDDREPRVGFIDFTENRLNPGTGTIRVRAVFPNKDGRLTPGQFARIKLPVGNKYPGLLVIDQAIGIDQGQKYVLIIDDKNKAQYRPVTPGRLDDDTGLRVFPPGAGLKSGEWVVVNGVQRVRPGMEVRTEKSVPMPMPPARGKAAGKGAEQKATK